MHTLHSAQPHRELRKYVRAYAQREVTPSGEDLVQPVPACLEQVLGFEFCNPPVIDYRCGNSETAYQISVVGPHTYHRANVRLKGRVESFAIFFQPLGLWQLFRIPASELTNRSYQGCDLLGKELQQIWLLMAESASFAKRVRVVDEYLLRRAATAFGRTSIMNAAQFMFQHQGIVRIDDVAHHAALSVRQFERRFSDEIGVAPKLFARIMRFQMALDAKVTSPGRSWMNIAHEFGYYDQMHMVRDFHGLSGASPSRTFAQLGDARPPALAASELL